MWADPAALGRSVRVLRKVRNARLSYLDPGGSLGTLCRNRNTATFCIPRLIKAAPWRIAT